MLAAAGRAVVETRELGADDWVVIPAGVAHGFLALEPLELLYLVTNEYDGSDELGFAWDDPAVGVPWPPVAATPTAARSCPSATGRTRPRGARGAASAAERRPGASSTGPGRRRTTTGTPAPLPHHAPPRGTHLAAEGAMRRRDHPAIGRDAQRRRCAGTHSRPWAARVRGPSSVPELVIAHPRRRPRRRPVAALGVVGVAAAAPTSTAKVVIIVGRDPRRDGRATAPTPTRPTPRRSSTRRTSSKVYSPNATWAKVKAAVGRRDHRHLLRPRQRLAEPVHLRPELHDQGRLRPERDLNGDGKLSDYENKYYGEPYMAQLDLAPNAIVLLHTSATRRATPSRAAPRRRVTSPASGSTTTPPASSRAAPGPSSPTATAASGRYLRGLFTTGQSIVDLWRSAPNYHGHESTFASTRSPGYTAYSDPDTTQRLLPLARREAGADHDAPSPRPSATPASTRPAWSSPAAPSVDAPTRRSWPSRRRGARRADAAR